MWLVTYVSTATERDDQQQQWPEAAHQRRGGEALSPAATASGSPHPRPCRARRGERTDLQKARRGGVPASSLLLLLLPPLPHSSLLPLLLGCAGALKHSCSAKCRAEVAERQRRQGGKQSRGTSHSDDTFTFPPVQIHAPRDLSARLLRSDFCLDCDHSALFPLVPNTHNHISLSLTRPGFLLHSSPFTFSSSSFTPSTNQ